MKPQRIFILAACVVVWLVNFRVVGGAVVSVWSALQTHAMPQSAAAMLQSPVVHEALSIAQDTAQRHFAGNFENPFRISGTVGTEDHPAEPAGPAAAQHHGLDLKGVLVKQKPLAIIEDANGKTWICGVGDSVDAARVVRITGEQVTVMERGRSFTISVKE